MTALIATIAAARQLLNSRAVAHAVDVAIDAIDASKSPAVRAAAADLVAADLWLHDRARMAEGVANGVRPVMTAAKAVDAVAASAASLRRRLRAFAAAR